MYVSLRHIEDQKLNKGNNSIIINKLAENKVRIFMIYGDTFINTCGKLIKY